MQTKNISLASAKNLINRYLESGGGYTQVDEGVLGLGIVILNNHDLNLKNFVIEEYYINSNSSGHKVKIYSKKEGLPKKYLKMMEDCENEE